MKRERRGSMTIPRSLMAFAARLSVDSSWAVCILKDRVKDGERLGALKRFSVDPSGTTVDGFFDARAARREVGREEIDNLPVMRRFSTLRGAGGPPAGIELPGAGEGTPSDDFMQPVPSLQQPTEPTLPAKDPHTDDSLRESLPRSLGCHAREGRPDRPPRHVSCRSARRVRISTVSEISRSRLTRGGGTSARPHGTRGL